jgi:hypothetical protein
LVDVPTIEHDPEDATRIYSPNGTYTNIASEPFIMNAPESTARIEDFRREDSLPLTIYSPIPAARTIPRNSATSVPEKI